MAAKQKIELAIIFGGRSAEHEVSMISARNIAKAINQDKYEITLVGISPSGDWFSFSRQELLSEKPLFSNGEKMTNVRAIPFTKEKNFFLKIGEVDKKIDVVFPVLHGPFGEDGTIQGMLKLFNVPYVGPDVLGSAVGMDKDAQKRLLREAGLPVGKFLVVKKKDKENISFEKIRKSLGVPFFIKPANLGSSIGISKIRDKKDFDRALKTAFSYDRKVIFEQNLSGKEIECSVLGNDSPMASVPGEIIPQHEFYSYEAKYLDANGAVMAIPANIPKPIAGKIQKMAVKTFETLCCEGMGRVDFFLTAKNEIFVNEINTIPGFTSISMYPKLWEASGISYAKLIDKLIDLAFRRFRAESRLKIKR